MNSSLTKKTRFFLKKKIEKVLIFENVHFEKTFHFPMDYRKYGTVVTSK